MPNLKIKRIRAKKMLAMLSKLFPQVKGTSLKYYNPWELLVATILSAQTTDKQVNKVTAKLFKKYRSLEDYVKADLKEFQKDISSIGFYRNKAKFILESAKIIKEKFNGKVPETMEELLTLPGVARKTANVILSNAFGKIEGVAVDTHVKRFSQKFGLTNHQDPEKIEQDLMKIVPQKNWSNWTYLLIEYGRQVCPARKHDCHNHPLTRIWPKAAEIWP